MALHNLETQEAITDLNQLDSTVTTDTYQSQQVFHIIVLLMVESLLLMQNHIPLHEGSNFQSGTTLMSRPPLTSFRYAE